MDGVAIVAAMLAGLLVFGLVVRLATLWEQRDDGPPLAERMT